MSMKKNKNDWRKWFAWRPVRTENKKMVWLKYVERKEIPSPVGVPYEMKFTVYREITPNN